MKKQEITSRIRKYAECNLSPGTFIPGTTWVRASSPKLHPDDVKELSDAVLRFWYTENVYASRFSRSLANVVDNKHVLLCNSGSSASLLAMSSMCETHKGKFVITCASGFPTTVAPIYQNNRVPLYVDIDKTDFQPRYEQIDYFVKKYPNEIAGAIFTHTMGFPYNEKLVREILPDSAFLISDCCDALGATPIANADISTFSFFPAHQIFAGEGGAIATNNEEYYDIARSYSNWGRSCYCAPGQNNTCGHRFDWKDVGALPDGYDHKYVFDRLGYNLKMTELQAALGWSQLKRLDEFVEDRNKNFDFLRSHLFTWRKYVRTVRKSAEFSSFSPFGFPIMVEKHAPFTRDEFVRFLNGVKIDTRMIFAGNLTRQPGFMNLPYEKMWLTDSDFLTERAFWIGCHPKLQQAELNYVVDRIEDFMEIHTK